MNNIKNFDDILLESCKEYEIDILKIDAYFENSLVDACIKTEEAQLSYIKENTGDISNYQYMLEEVNEGFLDKAKAAIKKAFETLMDFLKKIKNKIVSIFTSAQAKSSLNEIEAKAKRNPLFRNKKVDVDKSEEKISIVRKGIDKMKGIVAKISAGREVDDDEIDEIKDSTIAKLAAVTAITITAAAAIVVSKKRIANSAKDVSKAESEASDVEKNVEATLNKGVLEPSQISQLRTAATWISIRYKELGTYIVESLTGPINKIKSLFSKKDVGNEVPNIDAAIDTSVEESFFDAFSGDVYNENSSYDAEVDLFFNNSAKNNNEFSFLDI